MAKNEELPPMGLPLVERSSSNYFLGVTTMVIVCGAAILALGYGSMRLSTGPCEELYGHSLDGLRAEVEFYRTSGSKLGLSKAEIQALRASTQVAGEALITCCEQRQEGGTGEAAVQECSEHATRIAALPAALNAVRDDPFAAKKAILSAAGQLRIIAGDLTEVASSSEPSAPANVGAGPPSVPEPEPELP